MAITGVLVGAAVIGLAAGAYSAWKQGEINDEQYAAAKAAAKKYEESLEAPPGTAPKFTPEEYAQVQQYAPKLAQHIQETRPEMMSEGNSQSEIRAQREGLDAFRNRAMTGKDVISDAQQEEALFSADAQAKGRREQTLHDLANRGLSGSGQDLFSQQVGSQQAQVNARQQSLDAAKQAEGRRMDALGQMTNLATNVRGQNRQTEQVNADIMNSYNQRLSSGQNQYNNHTAQIQNNAQEFNIQNNSRINSANTGLRNDTNKTNMMNQYRAEQDLRDFNNNRALNVANISNKLAANNQDNQSKQNAMINNTVQSGVAAGGQIASGYQAGQERAADRATYGGRTKSKYTNLAGEDELENTRNNV